MAVELKLDIRREISQEILECASTELHRYLDGPTIFDLSNNAIPLFVSTLLHGNETSGWDAVRKFIQNRDLNQPENSLVVFVGNIEAAKTEKRRLPHQNDYNRIWCGGISKEHCMAEQVVSYIAQKKPYFALDVHNNSGPNPHYGVLTNQLAECKSRARQFSDLAILALEQDEILSRRMNEICPAITIECGVPGEPRSSEVVYDYLCELTNPKSDTPTHTDLSLYKAKYRVILKSATESGFEDFPEFNCALDASNFALVEAGTLIATHASQNWFFEVTDFDGLDLTHEYLNFANGQVTLKQDTILGMFTRSPENILFDCVCYVLEHLN